MSEISTLLLLIFNVKGSVFSNLGNVHNVLVEDCQIAGKIDLLEPLESDSEQDKDSELKKLTPMTVTVPETGDTRTGEVSEIAAAS